MAFSEGKNETFVLFFQKDEACDVKGVAAIGIYLLSQFLRLVRF